MDHTIHRPTQQRKAKKSYTLSHESVAFLETIRRTRRAASVSAILEDILQTARRQQEKAAIDRAVADYYGSLSGTEAEDLAAWGEFALGEFPNGEA
jgi:hypothetical protein